MDLDQSGQEGCRAPSAKTAFPDKAKEFLAKRCTGVLLKAHGIPSKRPIRGMIRPANGIAERWVGIVESQGRRAFAS